MHSMKCYDLMLSIIATPSYILASHKTNRKLVKPLHWYGDRLPAKQYSCLYLHFCSRLFHACLSNVSGCRWECSRSDFVCIMHFCMVPLLFFYLCYCCWCLEYAASPPLPFHSALHHTKTTLPYSFPLSPVNDMDTTPGAWAKPIE